MKRIIMVLTVLLLTAPAFAAVVVEVANVDANTYNIEYSGDLPRAFALKVTATDGNIVDVNNYFEGEGAGYGIFMGSIDINDITGEPDLWGSPIVDGTKYADAAGTGLDTNTVILEMGALYTAGNGPTGPDVLCTVTVSSGTTKLCVESDSTRGHVVFDGNPPTSQQVAEVCGEPGPSCPAGSCDGNLTGDTMVNINDVMKLVNYLNDFGGPFRFVPNTSDDYDPCLNLNGDTMININDIMKLVNYINDYGGPFRFILCDGPGFPE